MSNQPESTVGGNPLFQPYIEFWESSIRHANAATQKMFETGDGVSDLRTWQRRWLEATSRSIDAYLRSPVFLNAMKQNMDASIQTKLRVDDIQKEITRNANIPTASDISGLFERLRGIEELILVRLREIEQRLETIENGLVGKEKQ